MATLLEQWWAVQQDPDLTSEMKNALIASLRIAAYEAIELPVGIGDTSVTITAVRVSGTTVECDGTGPLSWPLLLHSPPIGIPDADGSEVAPDGTTWRTDPIEVVANAVRSVP